MGMQRYFLTKVLSKMCLESNLLTQSFTTITLQHCTMLDCEPFHDLKGHPQNVCRELPNILK